MLPDDLEPVDTPGTWATLLPSLDPTVIAHRPDGTVAVQYLKPTSPTHRSLVDESIDRYLVGVGDTVVRPRYPAPLHSELISRVSGDSPA